MPLSAVRNSVLAVEVPHQPHQMLLRCPVTETESPAPPRWPGLWGQSSRNTPDCGPGRSRCSRTA